MVRSDISQSEHFKEIVENKWLKESLSPEHHIMPVSYKHAYKN